MDPVHRGGLCTKGPCFVYVPRLQAKVGTGPRNNKSYQRKSQTLTKSSLAIYLVV